MTPSWAMGYRLCDSLHTFPGYSTCLVSQLQVVAPGALKIRPTLVCPLEVGVIPRSMKAIIIFNHKFIYVSTGWSYLEMALNRLLLVKTNRTTFFPHERNFVWIDLGIGLLVLGTYYHYQRLFAEEILSELYQHGYTEVPKIKKASNYRRPRRRRRASYKVQYRSSESSIM